MRKRADSYERLELLGDAVLQLVVTAELMRRHPSASEGDLAWMRQDVVSTTACAEAARAAGLPDEMARRAPHDDAWKALRGRASVEAALAEAVIGAGYLDLPREDVEAAVLAAFEGPVAAAVPGRRDPKTSLQELVQRDGGRVRYELAATEGPPHRRRFTSRVVVDGRELSTGSGPSKQSSEQAAATAALRVLVPMPEEA
ncbi:MAG: ribonuclease III [Thermoleophilia bacterium]|nr:ribonuclease III [Thermoleophilia bacterium]